MRAASPGRPPHSPLSGERLEQLRRWSTLLDQAFRVPGTSWRFGLDPLLGLVPWVGDLVAPAFGVAVLLTAIRLRIPRIVQLRMVLNVAIDAVVGAVPLVGDLFDFAWKANAKNLALLERHAGPERPPTSGDWLFVSLALALIALCVIVPLFIATVTLAWLLRNIPFV